MRQASDLLMLSGVTASCSDCGDDRIFVPVTDGDRVEFCCTGCDAAVFLLPAVDPSLHRRDVGRVA